MMKILIFMILEIFAIDWIGLHREEDNDDICNQLDDLSPIQKRICIRYPKLMEAILAASKQTAKSCSVSTSIFF